MPEKCDVDDILCQLSLLDNMKALKEYLGNVSFLSEFPELSGVAEKLSAKIQTQDAILRSTIAQCGNIDVGEVMQEEEEE